MTNAFKVGDKVRVNSSFPRDRQRPSKWDISKRGVESVVNLIDGSYVGLEGHGLFFPDELDLIPVRKFKAGDRVYVSNVSGNTGHPWVGVHTVTPAEDSKYDYLLYGGWNEAVYESEVEALPTEFKKGDWVKVLEIPEDYEWWTQTYGIEVGSIHRVDSPRSIEKKETWLGGIYGLNDVGGPTVIKVPAPVTPETLKVGDRVRPNYDSPNNKAHWYDNYSEGTLLDTATYAVKHDTAHGEYGFITHWSSADALVKVSDAPETPTREDTLNAALKALEGAQEAVYSVAKQATQASNDLYDAIQQVKEASK